MSKNKVKVEGMLDLGRVIEYLESVVASLKAGVLRFESDDQAITLTPPSVVDVEMQASQKKDKEKFSFEITWRHEYAAMRGAAVTISSDEPAPEA
ncbi:MAG: amphi-Trp domain-containing protein [Desulfovibrionaceae bacterium]